MVAIKNKHVLLKIMRVVSIIFLIVSMVAFIKTNVFTNASTIGLFGPPAISPHTYYLPLVVIELINIMFGVLFFRKKEVSTKYIVIYLVFLLIVFCIPVYYNIITYIPTGHNDYLMGLALQKRYLNVYGIVVKIW